MKKKMKNVNENEKVVKSSIVDKVKEMQNILNDAANLGTINQDIINNAKQRIYENEKIIEPTDTVVRDLTKEDSILKEIQNKKSEKKTFTEQDLRETLLNFSFAQDVMSKFNSLINEEAKGMLAETKKAEEIEDDDEDKNPNIFIKLTIIDDRDRMLFKELLFGTSERRRPIFVNIGDYDFFFEYFDDDQPVFTFNKESFGFFFNNNLNKLKEYIKINKCSFDSRFSLSSERKIKFDNIIVEILNNKKKQELQGESSGTSGTSGTQEELQEKVQEKQEMKIKGFWNVPPSPYKKVYKVKTEKETLFILTDKPGDIFEKISGVSSVKVMGFGIQLDSDVS